MGTDSVRAVGASSAGRARRPWARTTRHAASRVPLLCVLSLVVRPAPQVGMNMTGSAGGSEDNNGNGSIVFAANVSPASCGIDSYVFNQHCRPLHPRVAAALHVGRVPQCDDVDDQQVQKPLFNSATATSTRLRHLARRNEVLTVDYQSTPGGHPQTGDGSQRCGYVDSETAHAIVTVAGVSAKGRRLGRWLAWEEARTLLQAPNRSYFLAQNSKPKFLLLSSGRRRKL
jgi:hypothetical protein